MKNKSILKSGVKAIGLGLILLIINFILIYNGTHFKKLFVIPFVLFAVGLATILYSFNKSLENNALNIVNPLRNSPISYKIIWIISAIIGCVVGIYLYKLLVH